MISDNKLIHKYLENSAIKYPDKIAIIHDADRITYNQLNSQADILGNHLQTSGLNKGDRVVILLENCIDYVTTYYASLKAGTVAVPLNPGLKPGDLQFLLNEIEPSSIITNFKAERLIKTTDLSQLQLKSLIIRNPQHKWLNTSFNVYKMEEILDISTNLTILEKCSKKIEPGELSSIIYTSGSTGKPKGVMLSHRNIVTNTKSICQCLSLVPSDIQMVVLPFFYVMGKSLLNTHIATGGTIVINNRFIYPAELINQMIEEKVTGFSGVASTYAYLLHRSPLADSRDKFSDLRYCSQAGGHMALSLKKSLRRVLPHHTQIYIMYGATEASARLTYLPHNYYETKLESIGKPIPGVTIRIIDKKGHRVPDGHEGEIVAQGKNIMLGYWKDQESTARVLKKHGYHTGDIGYRDEDGFLFCLRRKDGLLKVSGHRINPMEIEDFLMATNLLIESAVIGLPDKLLGKKLVALVTPKDDTLTSDHLKEACAKGLSKHKCPAEILLTKALPKNASGKINREKCVQIALN